MRLDDLAGFVLLAIVAAVILVFAGASAMQEEERKCHALLAMAPTGTDSVRVVAAASECSRYLVPEEAP